MDNVIYVVRQHSSIVVSMLVMEGMLRTPDRLLNMRQLVYPVNPCISAFEFYYCSVGYLESSRNAGSLAPVEEWKYLEVFRPHLYVLLQQNVCETSGVPAIA